MSYAGAAANIIGGELSGWANLLERNAMFDEYKQELARQAEYAKQGAGIVQGATQQAGSVEAGKEMAQGAGERRAAYKDVNATPLSVVPAPSSDGGKAPSGGDGGGGSARDQEWAQMRGAARATLGSYGDWQLRQTLNDIQNKESLNQVINFAGGTAGVYPYRAYQAQHSQDDLAMIGAAISSIGGGAANYSQFAQQPQAKTSQNIPWNSNIPTDFNTQPAINPNTGDANVVTAFA
jgi:hypothetical protein